MVGPGGEGELAETLLVGELDNPLAAWIELASPAVSLNLYTAVQLSARVQAVSYPVGHPGGICSVVRSQICERGVHTDLKRRPTLAQTLVSNLGPCALLAGLPPICWPHPSPPLP